LILQQIAPSDLYLPDILESAVRSRRLIVCEEGCGNWGFGAEILASIAESSQGSRILMRRVASPSMPIPSSRTLEKLMLPDDGSILATATEMLIEA
jgi:2-oxoisovalerate dehydrogenase E1 component